ncbi:hypothetical protein IFM12276_29180 [Nocardia sputorum]|uniref:Uncharacterized protein n=1 Tax=Nocardia sputorum TaxID=2984338 RepID=A0ABM8CXZ1_9NOCA|nr:hypothetical protein IFM12276_29180 [Nocardia sputorum]
MPAVNRVTGIPCEYRKNGLFTVARGTRCTYRPDSAVVPVRNQGPPLDDRSGRRLFRGIDGAKDCIVIEDANVPSIDDDRERIIWPESSALSAWWADVMGHRFPRAETTTPS